MLATIEESEACWLCGKFSPEGVCLGPHLDYDHDWAMMEEHVVSSEKDSQGNYRAHPRNTYPRGGPGFRGSHGRPA